MIKVIVLVSEAPQGGTGSSERVADVADALGRTARALAGAHPEVRGLVVSRVGRRFSPDDGVLALVEMWVDAAATAELVEACVPATMRESAAVAVSAVSTEEIIFRKVTDWATPQSACQTKLAGTAFRRDDFEPDRFFDYWVNTHAPIGGSVPGIGGYVVSRVRNVLAGDVTADALIEQWYVDDATFDGAQTTEQAQAAWLDVGNYAKTTGTFWLMTEDVIVAPPESGPGLLEGRNA